MTNTAYDDFREWSSTALTGDPLVSVVIPAYNEEWRLLPTIGAVATYMSSRRQPWELIVADDGSKDRTVELVSALGLANLRLIVPEHNGGKGRAVRRGVTAARGSYILVADADQSTPIEQFGRFLDTAVDGGFGVVIGSRAADGAAVSNKSWHRRLMSWGLRQLVRTFFGIKVKDTQCGFKLFTADAAHDLFERQVIDGFSFDLEVLYLAGKLGYGIAEVPVEWIDAPGSTVDAAKVAMKFLGDLVKIRANDLRGRYAARRPVPAETPRPVQRPADADRAATLLDIVDRAAARELGDERSTVETV